MENASWVIREDDFDGFSDNLKEKVDFILSREW